MLPESRKLGIARSRPRCPVLNNLFRLRWNARTPLVFSSHLEFPSHLKLRDEHPEAGMPLSGDDVLRIQSCLTQEVVMLTREAMTEHAEWIAPDLSLTE